MTRADYAEQRKDPRWQKKRLEIMERDGFKCLDCDDATNMLNVDHAYYIKGRMPWNYPAWSLRTVCAACHKLKHAHDDEGEEQGERQEWEFILEFISGKNPDIISWFWHPAAVIDLATKENGGKLDRPEVFKLIEETLRPFMEDPKQPLF